MTLLYVYIFNFFVFSGELYMNKLIIIVLGIFIFYLLYKNNMVKKNVQYVSEYDVIDSDNYITNDKYFHKGVWSGGHMGPDAPTGPAMGSTPMRNYIKPYLGISSPTKLYIDNPLI